MISTYNVAVIGQTGVGKSTFINYLYGKPIAKAGIGRPVTENGFHPVYMEINGLPVTIYDSWGIEVGKHEKWIKELDLELKKRDVTAPASEWFHSVFYCIQAGGARFQPCDEEIIKRFIKSNYKVSVVLTKCDQISEDDEIKLKDAINTTFRNISVISVCSENKKTRAGETQAFGKEDVEKKAFADFFDSLIQRLPLRCENLMHQMRDAWLAEVRSYVNDVGIGGFDEDQVRKKIESRTNIFMSETHKTLNKEFNETMRMFGEFSNRLGYSPSAQGSPRLSDMNFIKPPTELSWYEYPLAIFLGLPVLVYLVVAGKSASEEQLKSEIDTALPKINDYIKSTTHYIKENIQNRKAKALPLPNYKN